MENNEVIRIKLDAGAKMPAKAHEEDTGYDIFSKKGDRMEGITASIESVEKGGTAVVKIDTGVHAQPGPGYALAIRPKSRITKTIWTMQNSPGTIDNGYTGPIYVVYRSLVPLLPGDLKRAVSIFADGSAVAQMVVEKVYPSKLVEVSDLSDTTRGDGGFGSTLERGH